VTVGDLAPHTLRARLRSQLTLRIGPFVVTLRSALPQVHAAIATLYPAFEVVENAAGAHFLIRADAPNVLRRIVRRQAQFTVDGRRPFLPLPVDMGVPMLEAGLNWCIGTGANQFVTLHSATLERGGRALLMPASPGSGKSTLCAALVHRGWRLLSDEFALIDPATGLLAPVPRPVALKEGSIALLRAFAPNAYFGPTLTNNEGQRVAYLRPPGSSVTASQQRCPAGLVVVPQYVADAETVATPMSPARTVLHLAANSFNYNLHGRVGFDRLVAIADAAPAVTLRYSQLEEGVAAVERLATWNLQ